jgi:integrase
MATESRLNKDGIKVYRARVKLPTGKWISGAWTWDKLKADQEELTLKKQLRIGRGTVLALEDGKHTTVIEYYEVWREDRKSSSQPGWWISKDQMFRDYVAPILGHMKMNKVRTPDVARVLDGVREKGRSPQMVKHVYSLLNVMFGDALGFYRMIDESPVNSKYHRPKVPKTFTAFLKPVDAWALMHYVQKPQRPRDAYLSRPVWIQLLAGLRVEAIQGLAWDSVLWDSDQFLIRRAWKQKDGKMESFPKGKDWEYVPMVPVLKEYLWSEWLNVRNPDSYVCPGPKGGMLSYETYLRALKRMCKQAGVPEIATHGARHSCTELWVEAGASAEDLRRLLNHESLSSTAGYIHRTEERLQSIGKRVELRVIEGGSFPNSFPSGGKAAI